MARIRTFLSVDLGDRIRGRVADLQESLRARLPAVKWVDAASLHVTLHFLGEVNQLDLVEVCRVARDAARTQPAFTLEVAGMGCFPNPRRPKVLWLGTGEGTEPLTQLHQTLEAPLLETGCYRREERAYAPHLTLGRITSEDESFDWPGLLAQHADWQAGEVAVEEIQIMSSEPSRNGPVYSIIGRAPLRSRPRRR